MQRQALAIGARLRDYQILDVLGAGNFGITYRAHHCKLDSYVALKEYFPQEWAIRGNDGLMVYPQAEQKELFDWGLEEFIAEGRTLARLHDSHIVRVTDCFEHYGTAHLALDYVEGETLATRLQRIGSLSEPALHRLLEQMLAGLETVHRRGFYHLDIKPDNIWLTWDDQVVLLDFGAARQAMRCFNGTEISCCFSDGYSPPEQYECDSRLYGPWSDLYALGAVLYRCLGLRPLPKSNSRMLQDTLIPARDAAAGRYSKPLLNLIDRALALKPAHRYRSVTAVRAAARQIPRRSKFPLRKNISPQLLAETFTTPTMTQTVAEKAAFQTL